MCACEIILLVFSRSLLALRTLRCVLVTCVRLETGLNACWTAERAICRTREAEPCSEWRTDGPGTGWEKAPVPAVAMRGFSAADACSTPTDYQHHIGELRRRQQPSSVNVMVIIVMFCVLLMSDVIVDVTAVTSSSSHSKLTTWLRTFISYFLVIIVRQ